MSNWQERAERAEDINRVLGDALNVALAENKNHQDYAKKLKQSIEFLVDLHLRKGDISEWDRYRNDDGWVNKCEHFFVARSDMENRFCCKCKKVEPSSRWENKVKDILNTAPRFGADKDNPEGARWIQLSETLVNNLLRSHNEHS